MNWLLVAWALTFGFMPTYDQGLVYDTVVAQEQRESPFYMDVSVDADIMGFLRIYGDTEVYMLKNNAAIFNFLPFRADYSIGLALHKGPFELGIRHECDHGVLFSLDPYPWYYLNDTRIYMTFSSSQ